MRGAVVAHQTGPVNGQHNVQMQQTDVLHNLVKPPLEEGGIDCHHRHHALLGKSASHGHSVLLRDAYVEGAVREPLLKFQQAGAARHRRSNGADLFVSLRQRNHGFSKGIGVSRNLGSQLFAGHGVKFADTVEFGGVRLREGIALALFRHHMNHYRLPQFLCRRKQRNEIGQVVPVRRPQIGKAHVLKNRSGQQQPLQLIFDMAAESVDPVAAGKGLHHLAVGPLGVQIVVAGAQPGQVAGKAAHISADGHFVVVENDNHGLAADGGVVQALVGHAASEGAVADDGNHIIILMQQRSRPGHAQRDRHRAGCVTGNKSVRCAFLRLRKTGNAAVLPQTRKARLAAGQQLMHIRLVTDVEYQAVGIRIKYGFDGDAQLYHA